MIIPNKILRLGEQQSEIEMLIIKFAVNFPFHNGEQPAKITSSIGPCTPGGLLFFGVLSATTLPSGEDNAEIDRVFSIVEHCADDIFQQHHAVSPQRERNAHPLY